ncbi:MAG: hypothetical protein WCL44_10115 [bacterium]
MGTCFKFWTGGQAPADDGNMFGCASHGLVNAGAWVAPGQPSEARFELRVSSEAIAGSYSEVLSRVGRLEYRPAAAIILFAGATGMEGFLSRWYELMPGVPVAGGGAARVGGQIQGEIRPAASDVAVLLIRDGTWQVESLNVHNATGRLVEVKADGPRLITHIREAGAGEWEAAARFFRGRQVAEGRNGDDYESITFSDIGGRNVHLSVDGEVLRSGADLPADMRMEVRTVSRADVAARLTRFCNCRESLVFGCAGLRGLLDAPLAVGHGTLVGFMFGELVTTGSHPQFANLMAVRMREIGASA